MFKAEIELNLLDDDKVLADFFKCLVFHEIEFKVIAKDSKPAVDQSNVFDNPPTVSLRSRTKVGLLILLTLGWGGNNNLIDQIQETGPYD